MIKNKTAIVIGAGISGLVASCILAKHGYQVKVIEKNATAGGRAGYFELEGFKFDAGPSWYWMPEVFEKFFNLFGKKISDYFTLKKLDPSYRVFFADGRLDIPAQQKKVEDLFESLEIGAGPKLNRFLQQARYKYDLGLNNYAKRPSLSLLEFIDLRLIFEALRLRLFESLGKQIRAQFKHPWLRQILYFPSLFLGSVPDNIPALYSLMNYADLSVGSFYPMAKNSGGIYELIRALQSLAMELGVEFIFNQSVEQILTQNHRVSALKTKISTYQTDLVIAAADYQHIEQTLLPKSYRRYSEKYWNSRILCPSSILYYVGLNRKLDNLEHHNLFFDRDFETHAKQIYIQPQMPTDPLMYVCLASKTDPNCAPKGGENMFVLIPTAPGVVDTPEVEDKYWQVVVSRLNKVVNFDINQHLVVKKFFAHNDFVSQYNSFKGNAYGLANTLWQTAIFKPKIKSKLKGMYFTGQLTAPGPGMPTCVLSGQMVAELAVKEHL